MTDESTTRLPDARSTRCSTTRSARTGYYGAFGANMHTDNAAPHPGAEAIVASAQARGVPVISYKQLLDWVDGRNSSTIRGLSWNARHVHLRHHRRRRAPTACRRCCRCRARPGRSRAITRGGSPVTYTVQTIKGIQYAMFTAATATYHGDVRLENDLIGRLGTPWTDACCLRRRQRADNAVTSANRLGGCRGCRTMGERD